MSKIKTQLAAMVALLGAFSEEARSFLKFQSDMPHFAAKLKRGHGMSGKYRKVRRDPALEKKLRKKRKAKKLMSNKSRKINQRKNR